MRDHDRVLFEQRKETLVAIASSLNAQLGEERVIVTIKDRYANMYDEIVKVPHVMDIARQALRNCDVTAIEKPIRGGTDGTRLYLWVCQPQIFYRRSQLSRYL